MLYVHLLTLPSKINSYIYVATLNNGHPETQNIDIKILEPFQMARTKVGSNISLTKSQSRDVEYSKQRVQRTKSLHNQVQQAITITKRYQRFDTLMDITLSTKSDNPVTPSQQIECLKSSTQPTFQSIDYATDKHINCLIVEDSDSERSNCWLEPFDFYVLNTITVPYATPPTPPLAQPAVIDLTLDTPYFFQ